MNLYAPDDEARRRAYALVQRLARERIAARERRRGLEPWEVERRRRARRRVLGALGRLVRELAWWAAWIWCLSNAWDAGWREVGTWVARAVAG